MDLSDVCMAGREATFGGRWTTPCEEHGRHLIGTDVMDPIKLCDRHFAEVNAAGLVEEPYIDPVEFRRRERLRRGRERAN